MPSRQVSQLIYLTEVDDANYTHEVTNFRMRVCGSINGVTSSDLMLYMICCKRMLHSLRRSHLFRIDCHYQFASTVRYSMEWNLDELWTQDQSQIELSWKSCIIKRKRLSNPIIQKAFMNVRAN
jgi:hypothetical protein